MNRFVKLVTKLAVDCQRFAETEKTDTTRCIKEPSVSLKKINSKAGCDYSASGGLSMKNDEKSKTLLCLYLLHKAKGLRYLLNDCTNFVP